jgi:hypothetical protein
VSSQSSRHAPPSERAFGRSVGTVLVVLGAIAWWRARPLLALVLLAVGGTLVLAALVAPRVLRVPNRIWWRFAQVLGWINARIILSVFFFVVLTPVGLVMRLLGRNPLAPADPRSGWSPYPPRRANPQHYERMY